MTSTWTPDLTLNDEVLDRQHVDLFRLLADASAALDGSRPEAQRTVAAFAEALMDHLSFEERVMEQTLYPERARHRSAHEMFVSDLLAMRAELEEKGPTPLVAAWVRTRIPEWLRFHIRVNDAPLGLYLARRRPAAPAHAAAARTRRLS